MEVSYEHPNGILPTCAYFSRLASNKKAYLLAAAEAGSIHIKREVVAECDNAVMLYSIGKDSSVLLHLAMKAFYPALPPFPLLHVDTTWKFRAMYDFRDATARRLGVKLIVHVNEEGLRQGINPITHGSRIHTDIMKRKPLKQALNKYGFDAAFGGARRDEEKSRAWKIFPSVRCTSPADRPVVERGGALIVVDDERLPLREGEKPQLKKVRFRTLGCYPLTGAIESEANTLPAIIQEVILTTHSERHGRDGWPVR